MRAKHHHKAEETASRIICAAEELFRRVGYGKTAVADIARALDMSPANIYRFFPSKAAINEAIAARHLAEVQALLRGIVVEDRPAAERLERFVVELHRFNKSRCRSDRCLHDMVTAAMEEHWPAIEAHIVMVQGLLVELVASGQASGEFDAGLDPKDAAAAVFTACVGVVHPAIIAQFGRKDLDADARRLVRFLLRGLAPAAGKRGASALPAAARRPAAPPGGRP